ncbi:hypothetical protein LCGC14_1382300 [marine sediment metagenome]|uniref:Uncharacterized protein n=1 Tax=marine sediment metagenome TaxID=412755 RepID=A0A0F9N3Z6_9ZZZZ
MSKFEFPIPGLINNRKASQSNVVLIQIITDCRILLTRIQKNKEMQAEYFRTNRLKPFLLNTIVLDIKTLYLFTKIFLDYFIKYITIFFFPPEFNLRHKSFNEHVKSLKKVISDDVWFNEYKEFILKYEKKVKFRIKYVRDKMITHRDSNLKESWSFDDGIKNFHIFFDKSSDSINIDIDLKNDVIKLGKKFSPILYPSILF